MITKTYWAPLLHVYQPPTQEIEILKIIDKECYKPLFTMMDKHDNSRFCLNINGVLIELLHEFGLSDTIELLKNLVAENKIEILGTGKFHPILPLIPQKEVHHQVRMNEEINRKEFGNSWYRSGFFPPEMAISAKVAKIVKEMGYKWVIMSGIACPVDWPNDQIYTSPNGLQLFFRDDIWSNKISFKEGTAKDYIKYLKSTNHIDNEHDKYVITAMDGETFGHHIKNYEKTFLEKVLKLIDKEADIETKFISELDKFFPINKKPIIPKESSWSTSYEDFLAEVPYPLWKHPENNVHVFYWKIIKRLNSLMNLADKLDLTENWDVEKYYNTARWFYDRGIYSCPVWWANPQNSTWSPNLIYKGLELLIKAALNAQLALVHAGKTTGDGYFDSISYYHGLLLMELYSVTKHEIKKKKKIE